MVFRDGRSELSPTLANNNKCAYSMIQAVYTYRTPYDHYCHIGPPVADQSDAGVGVGL